MLHSTFIDSIYTFRIKHTQLTNVSKIFVLRWSNLNSKTENYKILVKFPMKIYSSVPETMSRNLPNRHNN